MSITFSYGRAVALALSTALISTTAQAAVMDVFTDHADTAAGIQDTVEEYRDALGPLNAPAPVNGDPNGRRQINWDAAPNPVSDPNAFPGDFFNADSAPRARGIEFQGVGTTDGFLLSATEASGVPVEFDTPDGFTFFSAERMFTPVGGTEFDVVFFDPANPAERALTRGLGVVFTDVERSGTTMSFFDSSDSLLWEGEAIAGNNASLSFLGAIFDDAEVARVRINAGIGGFDQVVMDDFIFGEPIPASPVPLPAPALMLLGGLAGLGALKSRKRV